MSVFRIRNPLGQVGVNRGNIIVSSAETSENTTAVAVSQQPFLTSGNLSGNAPEQGNAIDNIYSTLGSVGIFPPIVLGRTITFHNGTSSTDLDLYLTEGGTNPKSLTKIATINTGGPDFVWPISDTKYNFSGNFTSMPADIPPPQYNAGPTLAEFGLNQVWTGAIPPLRDTFDISTVPSGIGSGINDGPRSVVVAASQAAGFSIQQSYNYNVGVQIIPPVGILPTQTVTVTQTDGNSPDSIGFPNDTAYPKQQSAQSVGNYIVNFLDPVVSLP